MAEAGRGEHQLEYKRIIHNIDYTVHLIDAIGTWRSEGGNLHEHRLRSEEYDSRFEDYYQQQQYQDQEGNRDR
jgi:hypothetical protein